ncbi:response regulator transcription factor [Cohnella thailandensis]|uniref:Response regulator transcription factor n=1 Tax=Cohnella thailandensis TaxID=557557 RepID=A0A841T329_9BACL|nr:response regulator transcription factor [Cohnella thailandensis]MBB6637015.1 response regulator transcription factor [Cohnella thailandensis]MBP1973101.1 DNA-binding response OmpR family regulator [Cohnella thailandensis]
MTKILVIEDDPILGEMLTLYLAEEQFDVIRVESAGQGFRALVEFKPEVIILDLMLPDADGPALCTVFREKTTVPIIVTSMKNTVADRIQAISLGADDYLTKPYSVQELKVRIQAVLRRISVSQADSETSVPPSLDRIALNTERRTIVLEGNIIETTFSEYEMMKLFTQYPGRVFSREELLNSVRGIDSFVNERAIDVHITNLRRKIEKNPKEPQHIKTVWGIGYKFLK